MASMTGQMIGGRSVHSATVKLAITHYDTAGLTPSYRVQTVFLMCGAERCPSLRARPAMQEIENDHLPGNITRCSIFSNPIIMPDCSANAAARLEKSEDPHKIF